MPFKERMEYTANQAKYLLKKMKEKPPTAFSGRTAKASHASLFLEPEVRGSHKAFKKTLSNESTRACSFSSPQLNREAIPLYSCGSLDPTSLAWLGISSTSCPSRSPPTHVLGSVLLQLFNTRQRPRAKDLSGWSNRCSKRSSLGTEMVNSSMSLALLPTEQQHVLGSAHTLLFLKLFVVVTVFFSSVVNYSFRNFVSLHRVKGIVRRASCPFMTILQELIFSANCILTVFSPGAHLPVFCTF